MLVPRGVLLKNETIFVLTGNGWERTKFAIELYKQNWASHLVMVGSTGSRPPKNMSAYAKFSGIPHNRVETAENSRNTKQNIAEVLDICERRGWKRVLVVTSPHHALRTHLYLKKAKPARKGIKITLYPPENYSWFDWVESSRDAGKKAFRLWFLAGEIYKIIKYKLKGDL
ncbi:YdcF family protein [Candidatus Giovannonibacteria bacterium]|nr:YdcF family protein [Candidatus Giovannonibacteria bacterium]